MVKTLHQAHFELHSIHGPAGLCFTRRQHREVERFYCDAPPVLFYVDCFADGSIRAFAQVLPHEVAPGDDGHRRREKESTPTRAARRSWACIIEGMSAGVGAGSPHHHEITERPQFGMALDTTRAKHPVICAPSRSPRRGEAHAQRGSLARAQSEGCVGLSRARSSPLCPIVSGLSRSKGRSINGRAAW